MGSIGRAYRSRCADELKADSIPIATFDVEGADTWSRSSHYRTCVARRPSRSSPSIGRRGPGRAGGVVMRARRISYAAGEAVKFPCRLNRCRHHHPPAFQRNRLFSAHVQIDDDSQAIIEFEAPIRSPTGTSWSRDDADLSSGSAAACRRRRVLDGRTLACLGSCAKAMPPIQVVINNAGETSSKVELELIIEDPETGEDLGREFGLTAGGFVPVSQRAAARSGLSPARPIAVGSVVIRAHRRAEDLPMANSGFCRSCPDGCL